MKQYLSEEERKNAKKIDQIRVIVGIVAAAILIAINIAVVVKWYELGCTRWSLIAAVVMYSAMLSGLWFTIDSTLKEEK